MKKSMLNLASLEEDWLNSIPPSLEALKKACSEINTAADVAGAITQYKNGKVTSL